MSKPIAGEILQALMDSEEWFDARDTPAIADAYGEIEQAIANLPEKQKDSIMSAVCGYSFNCEKAAMLFGIRALEAMKAAASSPDFSRILTEVLE